MFLEEVYCHVTERSTIIWAHYQLGPLQQQKKMGNCKLNMGNQSYDIITCHNSAQPIAFVALVTDDLYQLFFIEA